MILLLALVVLAGFFYATQCHMQFYKEMWQFNLDLPVLTPTKWEDRTFVPFWSIEWWDYNVSHRNKYRERDSGLGPAFLWSTWIFVWVTDAFHFFQMLWGICLFLALGLATSVGYDFLIVGATAWVVFKSSFSVGMRLWDRIIVETQLLEKVVLGLRKIYDWPKKKTINRVLTILFLSGLSFVLLMNLDAMFDNIYGTDTHWYGIALGVTSGVAILAIIVKVVQNMRQ